MGQTAIDFLVFGPWIDFALVSMFGMLEKPGEIKAPIENAVDKFPSLYWNGKTYLV